MFSFLFTQVREFFSDTFQTLLLAFAIFAIIYVFLFRPFQVSGISMFPNFQDREYILTNIIALRLEPLKRGDVIVFVAPVDQTKDYIKRVIGLPGDTIELKNGSVYVNGKLYDESAYLKDTVKTYGGEFLKDNTPLKVPSDSLFVMGDNREFSSDSREWGLLKRSAVIGKAFFVYWPLNDMRLVKNPFLKN